jgi:selenide,water dikinase
MGAVPESALALVLARFEAAAKMEETIYQLLSGVILELDRMGAVLLGGHTSESDVLGLGLVCNGLVRPDSILRKRGLQEGDKLILTKPLGTGTLFAAEMRLKTKGRWIDEAIESMLISNKEAGECLLRNSASACTDVTGFGLAGHMLEMADASGMRLKLALDSVPLLNGTADSLEKGILSSLHRQNRDACLNIERETSTEADPRFEVLFDPQTSGGLLAGIPADRANDCLLELHSLGYKQATCVGSVTHKDEKELALRII